MLPTTALADRAIFLMRLAVRARYSPTRPLIFRRVSLRYCLRRRQSAHGLADFPRQFQDLVFESSLGRLQDIFFDIAPSRLSESLEVENLRIPFGQSEHIQREQRAAALDTRGTIPTLCRWIDAHIQKPMGHFIVRDKPRFLDTGQLAAGRNAIQGFSREHVEGDRVETTDNVCVIHPAILIFI